MRERERERERERGREREQKREKEREIVSVLLCKVSLPVLTTVVKSSS